MFKVDQKVIYLKDNKEATILGIQESPVLNQHLDTMYKSYCYTILTWEADGPLVDIVNSEDIIDKYEWIKNNRDIKINNIINGKV